jgi:hypothetical protein
MQRQDKIDVLGTERFSMPDKGPGTGGLAMALLLGSAAIALALVLPPIAERLIHPQSTGLDPTITGSTENQAYYTIRRSILQPSPDSVCIIRANGQRSGDC